MMQFVIHCCPTAWAAPRVTKRGTYSPKHKEMDFAILDLKAQWAQRNREAFTGPLKVDILAFMRIPKSVSHRVRQDMIAGKILPITKPDRINLGKFAEDALQRAGIISNDSIIVAGDVSKLYSLSPETVITIASLEVKDATEDRKEQKNDKLEH